MEILFPDKALNTTRLSEKTVAEVCDARKA